MKQAEIPFRQLWLSLTAAMVVRTFYTFPRGAAMSAYTAAPWAVVLAGAVALLLFWPVAAVLARRPGTNLADLALEATGRPGAIVTALSLSALLVSGTGFGLRQASEMAVTAFYPHTPQTFAMTSLMVVAVLGAALAPPSLVWIGAISAIPTLIAIGLILVGNVAWGQLRYLVPLAGPGLGMVIREILPLSSYFGELVFLTIIGTYLARPRDLLKGAAWSMAVSTVIGAAVVAVYLMVFPVPGGLSFPFPVLEMTRLVTGGRFLERVDLLFIWLWAVGSAGLAAGALQSAALLMQGAFRLPDHRSAVLPLAAATLAAALFPSNQASAIAAEIEIVRRWGFVLTLMLPLALAVIALIRRRGQGA